VLPHDRQDLRALLADARLQAASLSELVPLDVPAPTPVVRALDAAVAHGVVLGIEWSIALGEQCETDSD
jgi:hypothetical protein